MFIRILSATFCLLFVLTSCSEEPAPNNIIPVPKATIKGIVHDTDTNEPIYYAKITTIPPTKETYTGIDGNFILEDVFPREYVVYSYQQGYDDDSVSILLTDGDTAYVNMDLNNFSEYLDYYPLDIGNYWEYWHGDSPLFSLEAISDTTISGKIYRVIRYKSLTSQNIDYRYERVDEYNAMVYRYFSYYLKEMIIDSLAAKAGQEFSSSMFFHPDVSCYSICNSIKVEEIFGEPRMIRSLSHACATDLPSYQIIKGLGLYSASFWRAGGYKLKYAIINGVEYGDR